MNVLLVGQGNMGKILYSLLKDEVVLATNNFNDIDFNDNINIDVIIDFSNRENIPNIIKYSEIKKCKVIIATTNLNEEDYNELKELSNKTAVMIDSNYSYGIYILKKIIKENILLFKDYDIELIDIHHKYKLDAPSGTMKSIESIFKDNELEYTVDVIRKGTIKGEHKVLLYGDEEYIEINHVALSRKIFANGAINAARWILTKEKGLFSFEDYILKK